MQKLSKKQIQYLRWKCRTDLVFLAKLIGFEDLAPLHYEMSDFICSEGNRKVLCGFRSSFKSSIALARAIQKVIEPTISKDTGINRRILIVLNNQKNASTKLRIIKSILERDELFRALFPEIIPANLKAVKWSEHEVELWGREANLDTATFTAVGVGGQTVSQHYTDLILDDIVAAKKDDQTQEEILPNREEIDEAIGWFRNCDALLENFTKNEILVLCNRWVQGDHFDFILELNKTLPDKYQYKVFNRAIIEDGKPTFPERYDIDAIDAIRISKGSYIFNAQYLNTPVNPERQVFRQDWFKTYRILPDVPMKIFMSIDRAVGKTKRADYTVIFVAGMDEKSNIYVLHYDRGHYNTFETIDRIISLHERYHPIETGIETVVFEEDLNQFLQKTARERGIHINFIELRPRQRAKISRIQSLQPFFEAGRVFYKNTMRELETELIEFSLDESHRTDDILDAFAYWLTMARPARGAAAAPAKRENPFSFEYIMKELGITENERKINPAVHREVREYTHA